MSLAHHGLRVSYERSLSSSLDDYIAKVLSQVVEGVPANIPRALLPEYITDLILKRSGASARFAIYEFFSCKLSLDPAIEVVDSDTVFRVTRRVHRLGGSDVRAPSPIMPKLILISRGSPTL